MSGWFADRAIEIDPSTDFAAAENNVIEQRLVSFVHYSDSNLLLPDDVVLIKVGDWHIQYNRAKLYNVDAEEENAVTVTIASSEAVVSELSATLRAGQMYWEPESGDNILMVAVCEAVEFGDTQVDYAVVRFYYGSTSSAINLCGTDSGTAVAPSTFENPAPTFSQPVATRAPVFAPASAPGGPTRPPVDAPASAPGGPTRPPVDAPASAPGGPTRPPVDASAPARTGGLKPFTFEGEFDESTAIVETGESEEPASPSSSSSKDIIMLAVYATLAVVTLALAVFVTVKCFCGSQSPTRENVRRASVQPAVIKRSPTVAEEDLSDTEELDISENSQSGLIREVKSTATTRA